MSKFFLDTNFFLDIADSSRARHSKARRCLVELLSTDKELYTSSDILTTIAYFVQKYADLTGYRTTIDIICNDITILCANNEDFILLNKLLEGKSNTIDYEDALQFYLANKYNCSHLVTSDLSFCKTLNTNFETHIIDIETCTELCLGSFK